MRKINKLLAFGLTAALCISFVGCGSKTETTDSGKEGTEKVQTEAESSEDKDAADTSSTKDKVSIVLATNWGEGDSKYDYFYPKFQEFQKANADTMEITLQTYTTVDYKTKIKTQTASGDLPDVFTYWGGSMMSDMVDAGLLLNVDDYFTDSESVSRDDFDPSSFGYYTAGDGNSYGVPIESTRGVFIANKKIFDEYGLKYPTTYDELLEVSKVFNENGIIPIAMGSSGGEPVDFFFSDIYGQYEGAAAELDTLASDKKFDTDNALKVAEVLKDMVANKMFPADTVANGGWSACLQLYTDGKAAMTYTYPWMYEFIPDEIQESTDIIPIPQMPDSTVDSSTIMAGFTVYGFEINKASYEDTAKHDALVKVCDFLASDELTESLTECGMFPAKNVEVDLSKQKLITQKTFEYAEGKTLNQVHYTKMPDLDAMTMFDSSLDELLIQAITPQEFVEKIQAVLDKNK